MNHIFETVREARLAIRRILEQNPELAKQVSELHQLQDSERVKVFAHNGCGGNYHLAGKVPGHLMHLRVCDKCGTSFHNR